MTSDTEATRPVNFWAQAERAALCDLLEQVGPEAPTLCGGWTTRDLAAHLVIREGRIDAAMGITIPAFAGWTAKVQAKVASRPWAELVDTVRNGPPRSSMMRAEKVDGAANTIEFFVHHEDVRRGAPGWEPRELDQDFQDELWSRVARFAPRLMKRSPVGVVLRRPDGRTLVGHDGPDAVTVTGEPSELTMLAYGRREARVELEGTDGAKAVVAAASFGI